MSFFCGKCQGASEADADFLTCSGLCTRKFHIKCAGFKRVSVYKTFVETVGAGWMCAECNTIIKSFLNLKFIKFCNLKDIADDLLKLHVIAAQFGKIGESNQNDPAQNLTPKPLLPKFRQRPVTSSLYQHSPMTTRNGKPKPRTMGNVSNDVTSSEKKKTKQTPSGLTVKNTNSLSSISPVRTDINVNGTNTPSILGSEQNSSTVSYDRSSSKRRSVVGDGISTSELAGVNIPSKTWLYVGRVSNKFSEVDIINYVTTHLNLTEIQKPQLICKKLGALNPSLDYLSFRLLIDKQYVADLLSSSFWPPHITVNVLRHRKNDARPTPTIPG